MTTVGSCCQVTRRHVPAFPASNPAMPPLKPNHRTRSPPPPLQYSLYLHLGAALVHGSRVVRRKARAPCCPTWAHTLVCKQTHSLVCMRTCTHKHILHCNGQSYTHIPGCAYAQTLEYNILSNICTTPTHTCNCTLTIHMKRS